MLASVVDETTKLITAVSGDGLTSGMVCSPPCDEIISIKLPAEVGFCVLLEFGVESRFELDRSMRLGSVDAELIDSLNMVEKESGDFEDSISFSVEGLTVDSFGLRVLSTFSA